MKINTSDASRHFPSFMFFPVSVKCIRPRNRTDFTKEPGKINAYSPAINQRESQQKQLKKVMEKSCSLEISYLFTMTYKYYSRGSMTLCQIARPSPTTYNLLTLVGS